MILVLRGFYVALPQGFLRRFTPDESTQLMRLSRSQSVPLAEVDRIRALLATAYWASYTATAHLVGRGHSGTISAWVNRFNGEALAAVCTLSTGVEAWSFRSVVAE